jgi:hypothetical protein
VTEWVGGLAGLAGLPAWGVCRPGGFAGLTLISKLFACPTCGAASAMGLTQGVKISWSDGTGSVYACAPCGITYEDQGGMAVRRDDAEWTIGEMD